MSSVATTILEQLESAGDTVWGCVVYRTSHYDDEAKWQRFIQRLYAATAYEVMRGKRNDADLAARSLHIFLMDNRRKFENADVETVRAHFSAWIATGRHLPGDTARFEMCILANAASVESVLATPIYPYVKDIDTEAYLVVVDGTYDPKYKKHMMYPGHMNVALGQLAKMYAIVTDVGMENFFRTAVKIWLNRGVYSQDAWKRRAGCGAH